ncbi:hypothetical protein J2S03_003314 [Alicyclobacillus cycloheptanicus]|uniref:Uncharacterized protein n=1 Tax=Alicyclobacillus cycloheptanicus TaxID=1457 RepID=A0ABT9XMC2_9BACL|nr:hypothetical protein [Alicyclobacillus cycloheptanicus]
MMQVETPCEAHLVVRNQERLAQYHETVLGFIPALILSDIFVGRPPRGSRKPE